MTQQSTKSIPADELAKTFHDILKGPHGKSGRDYLENRGIQLDYAIDAFMLGYSTWGHFINRVVFPVFDHNRHVQTLTSRTVDPEEKKKHMHTPGVKMEWLYNETASTHFDDFPIEDEAIVLCESPIDVITLEQSGIKAVGAMGANNMNRGKTMKLQYHSEVYICFDNDINESGQKAADRVGRMLAQFNKGQEVYNIHIPFLLGSDVNSMYMADRGNFVDNFRELIKDSVRVLAPINDKRKVSDSIGPLMTKYPILDTVERYVDHLIPCGAGRYKTICPFHEESEPSFHVDEIKNRFKCFGCGKSGDTIDFLMFINQKMGRYLGFKDALAVLDGQVPQ